jgi:hypothetical protein
MGLRGFYDGLTLQNGRRENSAAILYSERRSASVAALPNSPDDDSSPRAVIANNYCPTTLKSVVRTKMPMVMAVSFFDDDTLGPGRCGQSDGCEDSNAEQKLSHNSLRLRLCVYGGSIAWRRCRSIRKKW